MARPRQANPELRSRILTEASRIISIKGESAMSMRELADACGANVAAIYYYFDSKDALLRAVIEERQYPMQLSALAHNPRKGQMGAFADLITNIWYGVGVEEEVWRLLLGESLRGNENALAQGNVIIDDFEAAVGDIVKQIFPAWSPARRQFACTLVLNEMYAAMVEHLFRPDTTDVATRARKLATFLNEAYQADRG